MNDWLDAIDNMVTKSPASCAKLVEFLVADQMKYLKPFLLECPCRDV